MLACQRFPVFRNESGIRMDSEQELAQRLETIYKRLTRTSQNKGQLCIRRVTFTTSQISQQLDPHQWEYVRGSSLYIAKELFFSQSLREAMILRFATIMFLDKYPPDRLVAEIANAYVWNALKSEQRALFEVQWRKQSKPIQKHPENITIDFVTHLSELFSYNPILALKTTKKVLAEQGQRIKDLSYFVANFYALIRARTYKPLTSKRLEYLSAIVKYQTDSARGLVKRLPIKSISAAHEQIQFLRFRFFYLKSRQANIARLGLNFYFFALGVPHGFVRYAVPRSHPYQRTIRELPALGHVVFAQFFAPMDTPVESLLQKYVQQVDKLVYEVSDQHVSLLFQLSEHPSTIVMYQRPDLWDPNKRDWKSLNEVQLDLETWKVPQFSHYDPVMDEISQDHLRFLNAYRKLRWPTDNQVRKELGWSDRYFRRIRKEAIELELFKDVYFIMPIDELMMGLVAMKDPSNDEIMSFDRISNKCYVGTYGMSVDRNSFLGFLFQPLSLAPLTINSLRIAIPRASSFWSYTSFSSSSRLPVDYFVDGKWEFPEFEHQVK